VEEFQVVKLDKKEMRSFYKRWRLGKLGREITVQ